MKAILFVDDHEVLARLSCEILEMQGYRAVCAYNANEAYVFLRERGFGTEQYPYNFYQRWLDGMLAKRINYAANRQNELMLLAMQERNEELRRKRPR